MKQFLKVYDVKLQICGPVFIGSGQEINKKEYIRIPGQRKVLIPDLPGMYEYLKKRRLEQAYEKFMMDSMSGTLSQWLNQRNIQPDDMREWTSYTLDCGDAIFERGKQMTLMAFVKDAYGCPYIPGSSLKGMLRTILIAEECRRHPERFEKVKQEIRGNVGQRANRRQYLNRETKKLEEIALHKNRKTENPGDMVNDILAGMIVSDSDPLSVDDLTLCQKVEYHVDGTETRLPLLRECLRPGTEVHFTLSLDHEICPFPLKYLSNAVNEFARQYDRVFLSKFADTPAPQKDTVWLGGGAGYVSKTVIYNLFGEQGLQLVPTIYKNTNVPLIHKHSTDRELRVSPHILKKTKYRGRDYQFGECRITFQELY